MAAVPPPGGAVPPPGAAVGAIPPPPLPGAVAGPLPQQGAVIGAQAAFAVSYPHMTLPTKRIQCLGVAAATPTTTLRPQQHY